LVTSAAVSARTDVSVHPDELTHAASARFYYDHWFKPTIGDPETLEAHLTNRFGVAYLVNTEPVYLLAGKFAVLTWPVFQNDVVALRIFNVALLFTLVVTGLRLPMIQLAAVPLLSTPQAWYVFSYFNGDALPLFLSTLAVATLLSYGRANGAENTSPCSWRRVVIAGALVGLILLSKPNYWTVLGFVALCLMAREAYLTAWAFRLLCVGYILGVVGIFFLLDRGGTGSTVVNYLPLLVGGSVVASLTAVALWRAGRQLVRHSSSRRVIAAGLLSMTVTTVPFLTYDWWKNGTPWSATRAEAIRDVLEATAEPPYRPSSLTGSEPSWEFKMHAQGVRLGELLFDYNWMALSAWTLVGAYGYLNISPPEGLRVLNALVFAWFSILIVVLVSWQMTVRGIHGMAFALAAALVTVVAASLGFSWLYALQAQGRYLLPWLPILGAALVLTGPDAFNLRSLRLTALVACAAGAVSFLLIYLPLIPKLPGSY